jgi:hypothetical protein
MAQPEKVKEPIYDPRNTSPHSNKTSRNALKFLNEQYNNTKGLSRNARGNGLTSEPLVQYGYHLRAESLARQDIFGSRPCCGTWEDFLFMSIGQKILQNDRFSRYISRRDRICVENQVIGKADVGIPNKPPNFGTPRSVKPPDLVENSPGSSGGSTLCPEILNVIIATFYVNDTAFGNKIIFERTDTWSYLFTFTRQLDGVVENSFSGTIIGDTVEVEPSFPTVPGLYDIHQSFVDSNGCQYCFTVTDVYIHNTGTPGIETSVNMPIPLRIEGETCPLFQSEGGSGSGSGSGVVLNARLVDCSGVSDDMILSGVLLDESEIPVNLFPIGTVFRFDLGSHVCFEYTENVDIAVTRNPPIVDGDPNMPDGGSSSPCQDCLDSICTPLDVFGVNYGIYTDGGPIELRLTNNTLTDWDQALVHIYPEENINGFTNLVGGVLVGETKAVSLVQQSPSDMYRVSIRITIGACNYCASNSIELVVNGPGVLAGVANSECENPEE